MMAHLVANYEDRFSRDDAHFGGLPLFIDAKIINVFNSCFAGSDESHKHNFRR